MRLFSGNSSMRYNPGVSPGFSLDQRNDSGTPHSKARTKCNVALLFIYLYSFNHKRLGEYKKAKAYRSITYKKNKTQNKMNYTNTTVQNNNTKHVQQMTNIETYTTHV